MKQRKQGILASYKLLWSFMTTKEKLTFVGIFLLSIVSAITKTFESLFPSFIIAKFTGEPILFLKYFNFMAMDTGLYILLMCGVVIVLWFFGMINYRMIDIFARKMMCEVNQKSQEIILEERKNLDFGMTIGEANYILKNAVDNIYNMIEPFCWSFATYFLCVIIMTVQLFTISIYVGLLSVVTILVIFLCVWVRTKCQEKVVDKIEQTNAVIGNHFLMSLTNLPMITIFKSKRKELDELSKLNKTFFKENKKRANIGFWYWVIVTAVEFLGLAGILVLYLNFSSTENVVATITIIIGEMLSIYAMVENWGFIMSDLQVSAIKFQNITKLHCNEKVNTSHSLALCDSEGSELKVLEQEGLHSEMLGTKLPEIEKIEKLEVKNLIVSLTKFEKVYNVNFSAGKLYVVAGQSGQGKTTLINAICGLRDSESGQIVVNKKYVFKSLYDYRERISYMFQDSILFDRSFDENVSYPDDKPNAEAERLIELFELKDVRQREKTHSLKQVLSGGEKKRIDIIRTISKDKDIYFLDEPTNELDAKNVQKVLQELKALAGKGKIVVIVSHDKRCVSVADEVIDIK